MITRDIPESDNTYRELSTLDLMAELRDHLRSDEPLPVDLVATLVARGENVNALSVSIMRGN